MTVGDPSDVESLKRIGAIVAEARDVMGAHVAAGVSTGELDELGRSVLQKYGARSAPQLAYGFPGVTCVSVNDELAHGIPRADRVLREGDLVNIDVSAELNGFWADTGASFPVGKISTRASALLWTTRQALEEALAEVRTGAPIRNIGRAVERRAKQNGFSVVRDLCGHGVGRHIHEEPSIPNTTRGATGTLWEGLVMTIEPFLTTSATRVVEDADGWTLRTPDGSRGAQFEHTLIVTRDGPLVVTRS